MKQMIAAVVTVLLLGSAPAAFAQDTTTVGSNPPQAPQPGGDQTQTGSAGGSTSGTTQAVLNAFQNMTPEQRQQIFNIGVSQIQNLTPDQLRQIKTQFDNLPPDQKAQLEGQILQMLRNSPQVKEQAQQQLQNLTPAQQQSLTNTNQQ